MQKNKAVKICFVCPKFYPLFNAAVKEVFGGAEIDLYLLACELAKDPDFEVSGIVADYGQEEVETINRVKIYKGVNFKKNSLAGALQIWRAMRKADSDIYMQETSGWGSFLVALFCHRYKRHFVYRTASQRESNGSFLSQKKVEGKAFVWALNHANKVIVQNNNDKPALFETTGINADVIPNAQRLPEIADVSERNTILWVGRSVAVKEPYLFLKLAEHYKDMNFVMICQKATGDNNYEELVSKARSIENLTFIERVPSNQIDDYFRTAMVFVNTSKSEGFPNTFIEACKWSVPILSLNVNPDDFLNKYECGICANGDWQVFENMLGKLLGPSSARYGQNARRYAEQNHDITRIIKLYKEIFYRLVGFDTGGD